MSAARPASPDTGPDTPAPDLDAVLLVSFGGPEGPDDVVPFLRNVTAGRGIPDERLASVGEHYQLFGGVSPINAQNRALLDALGAELEGAGLDLPLYWGNRNWHPFLGDAVADLVSDGHRHVLALVTSAFGSYSGCRQYREDIARAVDASGDELIIHKARLYWNHPGFLEAMVDRVDDALGRVGDATARLVFTAHSIPEAWSRTAPYVNQLRAASAYVAGRCAPGLDWDLVYQSRSGPPRVPWLEPDVSDHLRDLAAGGTDTVVVVPIGFVSDHMEVVYDLDTEAAAVADEIGLRFIRAGTVGTHPAFVSALRSLVEERVHGLPALAAVGEPHPNPCPPDCCRI